MFSFKKICSNVLPAGTYKMQITDVKFHAPDKATDRSMDIYLTVDGGAYDKRTVKDFMSEKAFSFRLKPFLTACGIDLGREFETEDELYRYAMSECIGKSVMVNIGIRNYNGNEYNNVSQYSAVAGSTTTLEDVAAVSGEVPSLKVDIDNMETIPSPTDDDIPF